MKARVELYIKLNLSVSSHPCLNVTNPTSKDVSEQNSGNDFRHTILGVTNPEMLYMDDPGLHHEFGTFVHPANSFLH